MAICMCVYPGMRTSLLVWLASCRVLKRVISFSAMSVISSRMNSFRSTSTWSLRDRPECIFFPTSPNFFVSRYSTSECTSSIPSSMVNVPLLMSVSISCSALRSVLSSSDVMSPMDCSIVMCAIEPCTSYFASDKSS